MELLTTEELAKRWKCSPDSLVNERVAGTGAPYIKVGRKVRYRLADVQAFEDRNRVTAGSPKRGVGK